jgi:hypothetical protein
VYCDSRFILQKNVINKKKRIEIIHRQNKGKQVTVPNKARHHKFAGGNGAKLHAFLFL